MLALAAWALDASPLPLPLSAQVLYGQLVGDITDPSNAVIPGASVTATNVGTSQAKQVTANAAGQYGFRELQPGTYTVAISQLTLQGPNGYTPYGPILSGIPPMETPDLTRGVIDIPSKLEWTPGWSR